MGSEIPKQYLPLCGRPVLYYSLKAFADCPFVDSIILAAGKDDITFCKEEIIERFGISKVAAVIAGGKERFDSVWAGLRKMAELENIDPDDPEAVRSAGDIYVMIHDGARPLIDAETIRRSLDCAVQYGANAVGVPVKDTIKVCEQDGRVKNTPDRSTIWQVQTPQSFRFATACAAYSKLMESEKSGITDDAMVVERMLGQPVYMSRGTFRNIKITTPEDLIIAEALMKTASDPYEKMVDRIP